MPYVRKTKRRPSVSLRLKIVVVACAALAVALVLGALVSMQQERIARGAAEAANFTPAPLPDAPDTVNVAVIGDSYTGGSNEGGMNGDAWTDLLEARMENVSFNVAAYGGSGYVNVGPTGRVFRDGVEQVVNSGTELVVIFGSVNDLRQEPGAVVEEATSVFNRVYELAPEAQLLVIGPASATGTAEPAAAEMSQALLAAAGDAGATIVDPYAEGWFDGRPELIGADAVHPTSEGHVYMADLIEPHIVGLLPQTSGAS